MNSNNEIGDILQQGDKAARNIVALVPNPTHRFCIIIIVIILLFLVVAYFLHINQDEPEIQKGLLGIVGGITGGGLGGYCGAKSLKKQ